MNLQPVPFICPVFSKADDIRQLDTFRMAPSAGEINLISIWWDS
jgi:hypothetical protein